MTYFISSYVGADSKGEIGKFPLPTQEKKIKNGYKIKLLLMEANYFLNHLMLRLHI